MSLPANEDPEFPINSYVKVVKEDDERKGKIGIVSGVLEEAFNPESDGFEQQVGVDFKNPGAADEYVIYFASDLEASTKEMYNASGGRRRKSRKSRKSRKGKKARKTRRRH